MAMQTVKKWWLDYRKHGAWRWFHMVLLVSDGFKMVLRWLKMVWYGFFMGEVSYDSVFCIFWNGLRLLFKLETTNIPLSFHWILVGLGSSKHQTTWRSPTMEDADCSTPRPHPMVSPMTSETEKPSCVIKRGNCKSTWNEASKFGKSPGNSLFSISMFDYRRGSPKSLKSTDGLTLGPPHDENWEASGSNGQG